MRRFIAWVLLLSLLGCTSVKGSVKNKESAVKYIGFLKEKESGHDIQKMILILTEIEKDFPESVQIKRDLMKTAIENGDYKSAYEYNIILLRMLEGDKNLLYTRATLEEMLGLDPVETYHKLIVREPGNEYFLNKLSVLYVNRGDYKQAAYYYGMLYSLSDRKELRIDRYIAILYKYGDYDSILALKEDGKNQTILDKLIAIMITDADTENMARFMIHAVGSMNKIDSAKFFFTYYYLFRDIGIDEGEKYFSGTKMEEKASFYKASFMMENAVVEDDVYAAEILKKHARTGTYIKEALIYLMKHGIYQRDPDFTKEYYNTFKTGYSDMNIETSLIYQAALAGYDDPEPILGILEKADIPFRHMAGLDELLVSGGYKEFSVKLFRYIVSEYGSDEAVSADVWQLGVRVYARAADIVNMRSCYYKAEALNKEDAALMNHYGYSLLLLEGYSSEAFEILLRTRKLKAEDAAVADSLGWAYYLKGDYGKALNLIDEALDSLPDDPEVIYHKGKIMMATGFAKEGKKLIDEARKADKKGQLYYVDFQAEQNNSRTDSSR